MNECSSDIAGVSGNSLLPYKFVGNSHEFIRQTGISAHPCHNVGKLLVDQLLVLLVTNQVNNKKAERAEMEKKATGHRWCKETKKQTFTLLTSFLKQVLVILTVKDGHCYTKRHVFVVLISSC